MGRFDISPEVEAEYRQKFRDSVQPHVDGEVLAVGPFRPTGAGTEYAISKTQAGALAYGAASLIGKKRASGLPGRFLLAVTPSKLYAFKYKQKRSGIEVKDQVAEWDRAGTKASANARSTTKRVTIETGEGDKIVCDAEGLGHNPWADDVVRMLEEPSGA
jgi:hypothetical protein